MGNNTAGKKITKEEILHIAHLARLELKPDEIEMFYSQIESILDYVSQLQGIKEISHLKVDSGTSAPVGDGLKNVMRSDDAPYEKREDERESLLNNAPARSGDYFKVKKVIE